MFDWKIDLTSVKIISSKIRNKVACAKLKNLVGLIKP